MAGAEFEIADATDILQDEESYRAMRNIYAKNWAQKSKLREKLLGGFDEAIKNGGSDVSLYVYRKDGEVVAFCRVDKIGANQRYFASLNVSPSLKQSDLGRALRQEILKRESRENDIVAECDPSSKVSSDYVEYEGYAVNKIYPNYENTGEFIFGILREKGQNKYHYRERTREEIIAQYLKDQMREADQSEEAERTILRFRANSPEMQKRTDELINQKGLIMTRYFFSSNGEDVYCCFERSGSAES